MFSSTGWQKEKKKKKKKSYVSTFHGYFDLRDECFGLCCIGLIKISNLQRSGSLNLHRELNVLSTYALKMPFLDLEISFFFQGD